MSGAVVVSSSTTFEDSIAGKRTDLGRQLGETRPSEGGCEVSSPSAAAYSFYSPSRWGIDVAMETPVEGGGRR